ncbi:hypothetical protein [Autumnicola musiva]|uniref:Uncharacterized protein n=1 Tax=Autumnicola musiva TaxID=3075589 RepID=A0ABU3D6K8_9FLAO|nr:hypothetical protein [Zunongwangia sp. F117]MDT0677171.1 hypothetical protein [Zunongwangia sp. F117]
MKEVNKHLGFVMALLLVFALVYPSVHVFEHNLQHDNQHQSDQIAQNAGKIVKSNIDCKICDFHFSNSHAPEFLTFDIYAPFKETVYALSLAQTVSISPKTLFSLRAPPVQCV